MCPSFFHKYIRDSGSWWLSDAVIVSPTMLPAPKTNTVQRRKTNEIDDIETNSRAISSIHSGVLAVAAPPQEHEWIVESNNQGGTASLCGLCCIRNVVGKPKGELRHER